MLYFDTMSMVVLSHAKQTLLWLITCSTLARHHSAYCDTSAGAVALYPRYCRVGCSNAGLPRPAAHDHSHLLLLSFNNQRPDRVPCSSKALDRRLPQPQPPFLKRAQAPHPSRPVEVYGCAWFPACRCERTARSIARLCVAVPVAYVASPVVAASGGPSCFVAAP